MSDHQPLSVLTSFQFFFQGPTRSRLGSTIDSIHQTVAQELEPDYLAELNRQDDKQYWSATKVQAARRPGRIEIIREDCYSALNQSEAQRTS